MFAILMFGVRKLFNSDILVLRRSGLIGFVPFMIFVFDSFCSFLMKANIIIEMNIRL